VNWPKKYLEEIRAGRIVACEKIKAVYEREIGFMDNPDFPFVFNEEVGNRPIEFIEAFCCHSKGKWARQPVRLELFQKAKIQLAFGWLDKDGFRRFREVVDIRGRKNGKSTETAAIELYMLVADKEQGADVFACANKLDQSKLIFDEAVNMRSQSEALRNITKKRQWDIYFPATFSTLKPLAADTKTMDGLNAHFFSLDEFHEANTSKIYDVMVQSQSSRQQPMAWLISTNGFVRELFFDDKYSYAASVAMWRPGFEDYRLLPLIYELDEKGEFANPLCWVKANPGLGTIKSAETLSDNVEKAKRDPKFLPTILTKDFDMPENTAKAWLDYVSAVNETVVPIEYLEHTYAVGGCDLSSVRDLTAATLLIRKPGDEKFYVLQQCFLPKARVEMLEQTNIREAPYKLWAEQGWLTLCDGATVDFHAVTQWFLDMVEKHNIRPLFLGYDRALAGYWAEEMITAGFDIEKIAQGARTWTYPFKQLAGLFEEHRIVYQNSPLLRWAILNTGVKSLNADGIQSQQPVKTSESRRIDPLVSLLNAYTCYLNHEEDFLRYCRIKE